MLPDELLLLLLVDAPRQQILESGMPVQLGIFDEISEPCRDWSRLVLLLGLGECGSDSGRESEVALACSKDVDQAPPEVQGSGNVSSNREVSPIVHTRKGHISDLRQGLREHCTDWISMPRRLKGKDAKMGDTVDRADEHLLRSCRPRRSGHRL